MITILAGLVFVLMFLAAAVAWVAFVMLGLRWTKSKGSLNQASWLAVIYFSVTVVTQLLLYQSLEATPVVALVVDFVGLLILLALPAVLLHRTFRGSWKQTLGIWLTSWIGYLAVSFLLAFVCRSLIFEAFSIPSNSMAPTLRGRHAVAHCPECGETAIHSVPPVESNVREFSIICEQFHTHTIPATRIKADANVDRVLVYKCVAPQRWDMLVFRSPIDPSQSFVMRLVGFPGETLQIKDGDVWINGERRIQKLPIRYESEMHGMRVWGAEPVTLADDEYFVLGDFSQQSFDSRLWQTGDPNHAPYAVPRDHLIGVVTHRYWPIRRFKVFR